MNQEKIIVIDFGGQYNRMEHNSAKSRRLQKLVEMSYDLRAVGASGRNPGWLCGMFSV